MQKIINNKAMLDRKNDDMLSQYLISDYTEQTQRKLEQNPTTAATSYMIRKRHSPFNKW